MRCGCLNSGPAAAPAAFASADPENSSLEGQAKLSRGHKLAAKALFWHIFSHSGFCW
jgi:hypothetical protein